MPTVTVDRATLFKGIGKEFTDEQFEDLCFEFGIELEDVTSEREIALKESSSLSAKQLSSLSDKVVYRIDIPANRYDLLCVEGISVALKVFLGLGKTPEFKLAQPLPGKQVKLVVKKETKEIRPFVVAAILRDITFDQDRYDGFIELQDKLHNNICRKRTLVAIGTHDLDTISGPFTYEALPPKDIKFKPLNQEVEMDGEKLMEFYESDRKLSKYLHIIRDAPRYPVIYDSQRRVCSLPPIINGDHSKIKLSTKNVFIECTATDLTKAKVVLNTVVTMFSGYCKEHFSVEPVKVVYEESGEEYVYPDLSSRDVEVPVKYINNSIGISVSPEEMVSLVQKMSLSASLASNSTEPSLTVSVPPTRSDILHPCDVMEDVAIAYNINKIVETVPKCSTVAVPLPVNKLTDMLRKEVALGGYTEVLSFTLCSDDENFSFLNRTSPEDRSLAVRLSNPKTIEYQVVRTSLLPGVLKTLGSNKHLPVPIKVFEVSDVVLRDETMERRARNERRLCAAYLSRSSGFEHIHGLLDRVMMMLSVKRVPEGEKDGFFIRESTSDTFFPGRRADIFFKGEKIGSFGILHPQVLEKFEISYPCSALEINIEPFL